MKDARHYAEKVVATKKAKDEAEEFQATQQLKELETEIDKASSEGKTSIDYTKYLNSKAIATLRDLKFKVRDDGENVATAWHIDWGSP